LPLRAVPALSWCGEVSLGGILIIIITTANTTEGYGCMQIQFVVFTFTFPDVFVSGFGALFLSCMSVSGGLFSVGVCVCVCDLLIFLHEDVTRGLTRLRLPARCLLCSENGSTHTESGKLYRKLKHLPVVTSVRWRPRVRVGGRPTTSRRAG